MKTYCTVSKLESGVPYDISSLLSTSPKFFLWSIKQTALAGDTKDEHDISANVLHKVASNMVIRVVVLLNKAAGLSML